MPKCGLLGLMLLASLAGCVASSPKPDAQPAPTQADTDQLPLPEPSSPMQEPADALSPSVADTSDEASKPVEPEQSEAPEQSEPPEEPKKKKASKDPPDPCDQAFSSTEEVIDMTRRNLEETVCGAALWFDGLFGERRNIEAARGVRGRLETSLAYSEFYGLKSRTRFNVRADLPNMKERFSAFIGRENDDEFVRDRSEGFGLRQQFPTIDDRDEWLAGLGYSLPGNKRFQSDFRVGVRNVRLPRLFVQSRLRYNAYADSNDTVDLRLTPFWNNRDGLGITPGIDYSRVLSTTLLFRISITGTLSQESEGLDWRHAYILYQGLRNGRGLAYEAFIRGLTDADVALREYGLQTVYRQPMARNRLYGEFLVGYTWPKEDPEVERDGSYLVGFGLELPFGKDEKDRK